ncbi:hypothetical protein BTO30_13230 [Domibacillus antri]|uniref:Uncharacterized protein n=1 Tax=Domibacillus antri TaxID=1714264 RepID=A0A1Q8Q328_9BACI|nr:hypothetical protein [Domibacillus antri]OLN21756.1 hypothetical protein BTO30_13230 [Domibacillus antri]
MEIKTLENVISPSLPIYLRSYRHNLTSGYSMCAQCKGVTFNNKECIGCHKSERKYWQSLVIKILCIMNPYFHESEYQHSEIINPLTNRHLSTDIAIKRTYDSKIPYFVIEVCEPHHFAKKGLIYKTKPNDFLKWEFYSLKYLIPLFYLNIHEFISKENIRSKTPNDVELRSIVDYLKKIYSLTDRYYSRSLDKREEFFIKNIVSVPSTKLELEKGSDNNNDRETVDKCIELINYANSSNLQEYVKQEMIRGERQLLELN